ncbi:hypothetical protein [Actinospica robiniae]|uniref:hypothetical protein n=1 Tax=Actinospica robiniae TaxID=304901 RepID=UPI00041AB972|nr:hypothetical protein [Actinospica robiniae]
MSETRLAPIAFISGLVGLLVANLVLGPLAIILGAAALRRDRTRRARAALALLLGVADLAVFAYLALRAGSGGSLNWRFLG